MRTRFSSIRKSVGEGEAFTGYARSRSTVVQEDQMEFLINGLYTIATFFYEAFFINGS